MSGFLGRDATSYEKSKTVILPVPYEASTSYGTGTKKGPEAILDASRYLELYDLELKTEISLTGIFTEPPLKTESSNPQKIIQKIQTAAEIIFKAKKFPVILGGEHTVSIGGAAAAKKFYSDLTVLHFDAHTDLRDNYQNNHYSHGCALRRIREITRKTVSVGIRSCSQEEALYFKKNVSCKIYENLNNQKTMKEFFASLGKNVYVSFDLDALDPSIMPSVGTPEPGGLLWAETLEILKEVFKTRNVVGLDVVELSPIPGLIHPDFTAAKLIYKMIGYKFLLK